MNSGSLNKQDSTFLNTLRCLIFPRWQGTDDQHYGLNFISSRVHWAHLEAGVAATILDELTCNLYIRNDMRLTPRLVLYCLRSISISDEQAYYADKYQKITAVEEAVKQKLNKDIIVRTDPNLKQTIVIFRETDLDYRLYHLLQSFVPVLIPWFFAENPLTDSEKEMLNALSGRYPSQYLMAAAKVFSELNIRQRMIANQLSGFGKGILTAQIHESERMIMAYDRDIQRYIDAFETAMRNKKEQQIKLAGLKIQNEAQVDTSDMIKLFTGNPCYRLNACSESSINFTVITKISNFDSESALSKLNSERSYFYTSSHFSADDSKLFFSDVFGQDPKLRIRVCASYTFDIAQVMVAARTTDDLILNCIPNPHIDHFHCLGDYPPSICRYIEAGDYVDAIFQCAVSATSLNMEDTFVMPYFVQKITDSHAPACIELPDGNIVTPAKAIEWLKANRSQADSRTIEEILADDDEDDEEPEEAWEEDLPEEMTAEQEPDEMTINF